MKDALDSGLLARALGADHARLLSVDDIQQALLQAEISLFSGLERSIEPALPNAWYLHAVALSPPSQDPAIEVRRGEAGRVAAHIFDLHLQQHAAEMSAAVRLRHIVAAQSGYHVGSVSANAVALTDTALVDSEVAQREPGTASLIAAQLLLGQNLPTLRSFVDGVRAAAEQSESGRLPAEASPRFAATAVLDAVDELGQFLLTGDPNRSAQARQLLEGAIRSPFSAWDTDSRWVAALLTDFGSLLEQTSIWTIVTPGSPIGQALTLGHPAIYTLWPPQIDFLTNDPSPLDRTSRRMVLSLPTSAGKTLVAQILALHLIESTDLSACVIAPTHALCRELVDSFNTRLRILGTYAHDGGSHGDEDPLDSGARVLVLTPERFAVMLRSDPRRVLMRIGLFVVDEAHLLSDEQRGWHLEETLSTLHNLTRESDHQLVLVSAAMGQAAHARQWFTLDREPISKSTQWRGPRRLHALYGTSFGDDDWEIEPAEGNRGARRRRELVAQVHLDGPRHAMTGTFHETAGPLVQRQKRDNTWTKDDTSPNQISRLLPLVNHLLEDRSVGVLIVVAQRREARELAGLIAESQPPWPPASGLSERLAARLPPSHGLPSLVRHGVAYHHGLLPSDVQAEIERGARSDVLRCVVSTTTLTEGVNLPFKAVIIGSTGWGSGPNRTEIIDTARLLNAFGRAGRACRETEGWLFLSIQESYHRGLFDQFNWDPSELDLASTLSTSSAIRSLAELEEALSLFADAVLTHSQQPTQGFCSYVWFLAEVFTELNGTADIAAVIRALEDTLAWQQIGEDDRSRLVRVATASFEQYGLTPPDRRRRWGRSGVSLPTNATLEKVVDDLELHVRAIIGGPQRSYLEWFEALLTSDVIETLLHLPENPSNLRRFKPYPSAPNHSTLQVDHQQLLLGWVGGTELEELATVHLSAITDDDYRADALSEFIAGVYEHHLPWMLATLISWTNERLGTTVIPPRLSAMLRLGVASDTALTVMTGGIRSRRLAHVISRAFGEADSDVLRHRLRQQTLEQWREDFQAAPSELYDLLAFVRDPDVRPVHDLLDGASVPAEADLITGEIPPPMGTVCMIEEAVEELEPHPLYIIYERRPIATVCTEDHSQVTAILQLGLPIRVEVTDSSSTPILIGISTA